MHGGKRTGAGRRPGGANRSKAEIKAEAAAKAIRAAEREARRQAREAAEDARARARLEREEKRGERAAAARQEILPPLPDGFECPAGASSLEFLKQLMSDPRLPLGFRRDCAAIALPYEVAKPILGLKDARRLMALDDDDLDPIAAALRN